MQIQWSSWERQRDIPKEIEKLKCLGDFASQIGNHRLVVIPCRWPHDLCKIWLWRLFNCETTKPYCLLRTSNKHEKPQVCTKDFQSLQFIQTTIYLETRLTQRPGTAELLWKWRGWQVTQSGGAKNAFFWVTLSNFQKSGRAITLPASPPPRSLKSTSSYIMIGH